MWNQILRLSFNSAGDCWRYLQGVLQSGISWWFKLYSTLLMKHNFDIERPLIHTTSILRMWLSFDFEQGDYEMESGRLPLPIMNRFHQDEKALHQVCFSCCCCRCCPQCCWCCYNCCCLHPTRYESIWWGRRCYFDVSIFWFNIKQTLSWQEDILYKKFTFFMDSLLSSTDNANRRAFLIFATTKN